MQTRLATGMLLPTSGHLNVQNARNAEHPQPASAEQGQHGESVAKQMIHRNHKAFHHAAAKCNEKATATQKIARSTSMELHVALQLLTKTKPKNTTTAFQHSGGSFIGAPVVVFSVIEMHLPISGGAQTAKGFSSSVIRVNAPCSRPRVILKWQPRAGTCQPCAKIHRLVAFQAAVQVHTPAPPGLCQACKHRTQQRPRTTYSGNDVRRLSNNQSSHN